MIQSLTLTGNVVIPIGLPTKNAFALNAKVKTTEVRVDLTRNGNGWRATATKIMPLSAKKVRSTLR